MAIYTYLNLADAEDAVAAGLIGAEFTPPKPSNSSMYATET
jgi:hypothetical protein